MGRYAYLSTATGESIEWKLWFGVQSGMDLMLLGGEFEDAVEDYDSSDYDSDDDNIVEFDGYKQMRCEDRFAGSCSLEAFNQSFLQMPSMKKLTASWSKYYSEADEKDGVKQACPWDHYNDNNEWKDTDLIKEFKEFELDENFGNLCAGVGERGFSHFDGWNIDMEQHFNEILERDEAIMAFVMLFLVFYTELCLKDGKEISYDSEF